MKAVSGSVRGNTPRRFRLPLSGEHGTYQTVKARVSEADTPDPRVAHPHSHERVRASVRGREGERERERRESARASVRGRERRGGTVLAKSSASEEETT